MRTSATICVSFVSRFSRITSYNVCYTKLLRYWEGVRHQYAAFESGLEAPASEVYLHEMPGGQFTNLKAQARSMGLRITSYNVCYTKLLRRMA